MSFSIDYIRSLHIVTPNTLNIPGLVQASQDKVTGYDNACLSKMKFINHSYEQAYTTQGRRQNLTKQVVYCNLVYKT